jgi:DNA-binding MarR family transcriptional regulator
VARVRDTADRRIVRTLITQTGLDLLAELEGPTDAEHERQLSHLGEKMLLDLAARVDAARLARR